MQNENEQIENNEVTNETNGLKPGDKVIYTLKEADKEAHNLYGAPTIVATIKEIADTITLVIPNFENKVTGRVHDEENNLIANTHETVENEGIIIYNVNLNDIKPL